MLLTLMVFPDTLKLILLFWVVLLSHSSLEWCTEILVTAPSCLSSDLFFWCKDLVKVLLLGSDTWSSCVDFVPSTAVGYTMSGSDSLLTFLELATTSMPQFLWMSKWSNNQDLMHLRLSLLLLTILLIIIPDWERAMTSTHLMSITLVLIHLVKIPDGQSPRRTNWLLPTLLRWRCPSSMVFSTWPLVSSTKDRTVSTSVITLLSSVRLLLDLSSSSLCSDSWTTLSSLSGSINKILATLNLTLLLHLLTDNTSKKMDKTFKL